MTRVEIKKEEEKDFQEIRKLLTQVFAQNDEADLVERIRKSSAYIPDLSFVARASEKIVGHILFSEIEIESGKKTKTSLALAPVTVAKRYQRQGIGSKLIMKGLEKAVALGYESVILLGHSDYYPRFGFEPTSIWGVKPPFYVPKENFMGIELVPNGLANSPGTVRYPDVWEL